MARFDEVHMAQPAPGWTTHDNLVRQLPLALFDEIECGLIVCDGDGTLRFLNQAARHEVASARLLQRDSDRLLRNSRASGDLATALAHAVSRGKRTLVKLEYGGDRLLASVLPLQLPQQQTLALVMLGRRHPCSELGLEMLGRCYGLTLTESRVLAGLVREASPRQIAAEHAVKLSTVRTQISSIRAKLGARNIDALLLRAAEVPPVASALRMAGGEAVVSYAPRMLAAA